MPPTVSEADFQSAVIDFAQLCGWRVAHFRTSQNARGDYRTAVAADGKGFPDLVLAHPHHGLLFAELKSQRGRLSDEQHTWLQTLDAAGGNADVWRPSDWDAIQQLLRTGTRP